MKSKGDTAGYTGLELVPYVQQKSWPQLWVLPFS